jgi:hypothetical protein
MKAYSDQEGSLSFCPFAQMKSDILWFEIAVRHYEVAAQQQQQQKKKVQLGTWRRQRRRTRECVLFIYEAVRGQHFLGSKFKAHLTSPFLPFIWERLQSSKFSEQEVISDRNRPKPTTWTVVGAGACEELELESRTGEKGSTMPISGDGASPFNTGDPTV